MRDALESCGVRCFFQTGGGREGVILVERLVAYDVSRGEGPLHRRF